MGHDNTVAVERFLDEAANYVRLSDVRVVLEIGSRDALVALQLKRALKNAVVYAFECNPDAIKLCRQNIDGEEGVFLVEKAVCDKVGQLDFFAIDPLATKTVHEDGNIGASSLFVADPSYPHEKYVQNRIVVEGTTLERWAQEMDIRCIDLIWMDLQGAELMALRGLGRKLIRTLSVLYTEVEYKQIYINQPLAREVRGYLVQNGLTMVKRMYADEWFGDELFVSNRLLHFWRRLWYRLKASRL